MIIVESKKDLYAEIAILRVINNQSKWDGQLVVFERFSG